MVAAPAMTTRTTQPTRRERLLALLADGEFHSGERLAARLRVSRSAIWKIVRTLRELGIEIEAAAKQGYRLSQPVELYNRADIINALLQSQSSITNDDIASLDVLLAIDSTNRYLVDAQASPPRTAQICVAEIQSAGRGRRGRSWVAPFGSGLCLSLAWHFEESPPTLTALSLAIGVAVVRALDQFGDNEVQLKWPNDLLWRRRKLGGILIEMRGESGGPTRVVIGLGLNVRMPASARLNLAEQQATLVADLHEALGQRTPGRNALLAGIIAELMVTLRAFEQNGFAAFADEWRARDALRDAPVRVLLANEVISGTARGAAPDGALLVEVAGEMQRFVSGDVSLRASA
ncbi:MAG: bifunctional biotin--[acetyl-CoA-carboxylase] ligase/biotin operon repressor BirA [Candidatus Obscuribacterales bacterium]|nr:bifunctional biotin--[acetyl-CoA-carboxylase] ligase/biotin operon repressor BirA [Steroidobacteraceae bacterium]